MHEAGAGEVATLEDRVTDPGPHEFSADERGSAQPALPYVRVLGHLAGQSSAAVGSTATATAGQTVQSQQAGNNDPNQVYNTGGHNNANQCTWMHQKVTENSSSASIGGGSAAGVGASWDPVNTTNAFDRS